MNLFPTGRSGGHHSARTLHSACDGIHTNGAMEEGHPPARTLTRPPDVSEAVPATTDTAPPATPPVPDSTRSMPPENDEAAVDPAASSTPPPDATASPTLSVRAPEAPASARPVAMMTSPETPLDAVPAQRIHIMPLSGERCRDPNRKAIVSRALSRT